MKVIYDKESDSLTVILKDGPVEESDETREGIILDYDREGNLISLEILDASLRIKDPMTVTLEMAKG
jgi:uncharacterized protein YuzE